MSPSDVKPRPKGFRLSIPSSSMLERKRFKGGSASNCLLAKALANLPWRFGRMDGGNDTRRPIAVFADENVDLEDTFEEFGPGVILPSRLFLGQNRRFGLWGRHDQRSWPPVREFHGTFGYAHAELEPKWLGSQRSWPGQRQPPSFHFSTAASNDTADDHRVIRTDVPLQPQAGRHSGPSAQAWLYRAGLSLHSNGR